MTDYKLKKIFLENMHFLIKKIEKHVSFFR